jgi:Cyclic nucleotide-binding domain
MGVVEFGSRGEGWCALRIESAVTSVSWIPSEGIRSTLRAPFDVGIMSYDKPLPDQIDDLESLANDDRYRFANDLRAWIEVDDEGEIVGHGFSGRGHLNRTKMRLGSRELVFQPTAFNDIQRAELGDDKVTFTQTAGGRTGLPAPRRVAHPPFVQFNAPTVWTTLQLTVHADGTTEHDVLGASRFPRHWIFDNDGKVVAKSGLLDFDGWYRHAFGHHTPWGDEDSDALIAEAETALEREMSSTIMKGGRPKLRKVAKGDALVEQGEEGYEVFLLLDGMLSVEVDGETLAELGPGAVVGERALLEGGKRTSTLRAMTDCRVAVAPPDSVDRDALVELSGGHRREEADRIDE